MPNRQSWIIALLGGACSCMILAPLAEAQRPRAAQTPPQERAAAAETLRLPPDQPIVVVTVQSPREVRVGRSFDYQIRVQNNSQNIAVHDLVIAQHAGEGFEIESSEVVGKPAGDRDRAARQQLPGRERRQERRAERREQANQKDQADRQDDSPSESQKRKAQQDKPSDQPSKSDDSQPNRDQTKSDKSDSSDSKPDDSKNQESKSADSKREDAKSADSKSDNASDDDSQRKQATSDDAKPDNAKRDDSEDDDADHDAAKHQESQGDRSPRAGARRNRSTTASSDANGDSSGSRWKIERLMPGESRTIKVTAASDSEGVGNVCVAIESYVPAVCLTTRFTKPELEIEKKAPEVANICDEIQFEYLVKNTGTGDLQRFTVRDELPEGLRTIDGVKKLEFTLDDGLKAGGTRKFVARLRATNTGEFSSRAVVEGSEGVEARSNRAGTRVQKADLAVAIEGPQAQEVGGLANYTVRVTNRGDAPAPGTQLRIYFPRSADLVRTGQPQKSSREVAGRRSESSRSAQEQAAHEHGSQAASENADDRDDDQDRKQADSAQADDQDDDPKKQDRDDDEGQQKDDDDRDDDDADRQGDDRDQASSKDQQVAAQAQTGSEKERSDKARRAQSRENEERQHMAQNHWQLGTLAPGETVEVTYVLRPYEGGDFEQMAVAEYVCATAQDREILQAEAKTATEILMLPGLRLVVLDDHDPVAVGQNVTYTITVVNQGNAPAHDIDIIAKLPKELKYIESKGASAGENSENEVDFKPVAVLEPGQKAVWQIIASVEKGVGEKTQSSIEVELNSDDLDETITSQEPTTLFEAEKRTAKSTDEQEPDKK